MASRSQQRRAEQDRQRRKEILNNPIGPKGTNDPVVEALIADDFVSKKDSETLDIALQLQQLIGGVNSLVAGQQSDRENFGRAIEALRARIEAAEETQRKFEENREKWYEEVMARAPITNDPLKKEKLQMKGAELIQKAYADARAQSAVAKVEFERQLKSGPREVIMSPGVVEMIQVNDQPQMKVFAEVISLKGHKWILQPGVPTEVPKIVAERYRQMQQGKEEAQRRSDAMMITENQGAPEQHEAQRRMEAINKEFGTNSANLAIGG